MSQTFHATVNRAHTKDACIRAFVATGTNQGMAADGTSLHVHRPRSWLEDAQPIEQGQTAQRPGQVFCSEDKTLSGPVPQLDAYPPIGADTQAWLAPNEKGSGERAARQVASHCRDYTVPLPAVPRHPTHPCLL